MLLFGASTFLWVLAPPRLAATLNKSAWWLAIASGLLLIATAVFWLPFGSGLDGRGLAGVPSVPTRSARYCSAPNSAKLGRCIGGTPGAISWQPRHPMNPAVNDAPKPRRMLRHAALLSAKETA